MDLPKLNAIMNRLMVTRLSAIIFFSAILLISCKQNLNDKKELWAIVINFFSPDISYYSETKKFPFPDSLRFGTLDRFFTNQNKTPIINDSNIVFPDNYWVNGKKVCCRQDTLEVYIDSIRGKKYLFAIGEYIAVFQSNNNSDTNLRIRKNLTLIPLWDIKLNTPYPPAKFKNEYEKLGSKHVKLREEFDEVSKQKWSENDSILVETIQFNNSNDRIITALYKDMNKNKVDSTIDYIRNTFPHVTYKEAIQKDGNGKTLKVIRMYFQGVSISFTQFSATEYTFMITDYYETIKLILNNAETGYIFRDDVKIY